MENSASNFSKGPQTFTLTRENLSLNASTENLFIFVGLLFSQNIFNFHSLFKVIFTFLAFYILARPMHILNDIPDFEQDTGQPVKCDRPLVSGRLEFPLGHIRLGNFRTSFFKEVLLSSSICFPGCFVLLLT